MSRKYRLTKKITEDMAAEILNEIHRDTAAEKAEFVEDMSCLLIETEERKYPEVMTRVLNICCRVGNGCELSFAGFEN